MTLRELILRHGGTVAFGYGLALSSSFGQTFFVSLSGPGIREAFGLSHGGFGAAYSLATLCSGMLMIWAGGVLDRVSTEAYAAVSVLGLALAALSISLAPGVAALVLSLFALRLFGQGMLGHAAITSTARLPQAIRGRAVGIATLGFSTGEMVIPGIGLAVLASFGWEVLWRGVAGVLAVVLLLILLKAWRDKTVEVRPVSTVPDAASPPAGLLQRRRDVLRDWRFLCYVPAMIAPPAIVTGYFFHQRLIGEQVGWGLEALALGVPSYAVSGLISTMVAGSLVDRFRAVRMCRFHLSGIAVASLALALWPGTPPAVLLFPLMAVSAAGNGVVTPALLAELYGTARLGTIRALAGAIMVVGSATTPVLFGMLFDAGVGIGAIGIGSALYLAVASALTIPIGRGVRVNPN
ncbi:MFS transporter [Alsobacter sp. R-9]